MALRQSSSYAVPYNPRDWGLPGNGGSQGPAATMTVSVSLPWSNATGIDISPSLPPPPYSPPSQGQSTDPAVSVASVSSSAAVSSSYPAPVQSLGESPLNHRRPMPRPRPLSMVHLGDTGSGGQVAYLPPPPPLGANSSLQNRSHGPRSRLSNAFSPPENNQSFSSIDLQHMPSTPYVMDGSPIPPASRRAVSAGAVVSSAGSSWNARQSSDSPPQGSWEPGMPLPPPPPGPPPTTRSQSVSGSSDTVSSRHSMHLPRARARQPPVMGTTLDRIPPTPADWVDDTTTDSDPSLKQKVPLHIVTGPPSTLLPEVAAPGGSSVHPSPPSRRPSNSGLFRSPAVRDPSAKGIRERRVERRSRQGLGSQDLSAVSSSSNPWASDLDRTQAVKPANLDFPAPGQQIDSDRSLFPARFTPKSARSIGSDGQPTGNRPRTSSTGLFSNRSSLSTPRPEVTSGSGSGSGSGPQGFGMGGAYAHTPPFSPGSHADPSPYAKTMPHPVNPKALPTPPPQHPQEISPASRRGSNSGGGLGDRPVSHLLHLPNDTITVPPPLTPRRPPPEPTRSTEKVRDTAFLQEAIRRHQEFIEKEATAASEEEALKLFADFVLSESHIRRERYKDIWDHSGFDVEDVRRNLFEVPPVPGHCSPYRSRSLSSSRPASRGNISTSNVTDNPPMRPESGWWNNYKPSLSPIASMSMSNESSRGRAPSRWWESVSSSDGRDPRVQRSKRESKYMGVQQEIREAMQWANMPSLSALNEDQSGTHFVYGPDEYPPEKVGWHEEDGGDETVCPAERTPNALNTFSVSTETHKMDVSRLITLPPPYPRHYPAVNNSHPDLVAYRTTVRSITDLSEVKATRQRHKTQTERLQKEHQERVQQNRRLFKENIQSQIQQGSLSFAEAAEAEAALAIEEQQAERELAKAELDTYQDTVLKPMHAILTDRIERATASMDKLCSQLFDDAQNETPDQTQAEGDEKPELLEKITQLKWLFEAREQLHREVYELVGGRDEKYQAVVSLPYKHSGNEDKARETSAFFAQDAMDRRVQHEAAALARLESFLDVIEQNVVRGVEIQLSSFWDIAPSLLALVQQIPDQLDGFEIQIPAGEYDENPSYQAHPLQYLYSVVWHAERSSYQYIESQTNLLCLLHEVKSAVMRANYKHIEAQRIRQGEPEDTVHEETHGLRADEERHLTADLKDKVGTVESQWTEALGSHIEALRERVKAQLQAEDGWEDMEQLE
ncbi:hypothetical protein ASPZODRAFT_112423 [Penicilliopsis zonata CBS 506.65]|uniref:Uncharacterized protein n=1 Tax=Penicilliopsis zonata CBS 506.65 TaxID=1073090 RepID=A0A1L9SQS3_9EURO|nr:hypothetical protein ASPZODRAFT_112423 [Penicilliopsis zonata CBS 506.65]OJJ49453.1 hypothetical protein ASPZODRAFT_112423 [Penicilliopsis zonata CBS 506.65]